MTNKQHSQPTLDELLQTLKAEMPALSKEYHVASLGIFGPYATGKARPRSRLGLLVEFDEPPGLFGFLRLQEHLSDVVGIKVDLAPKKTLRPEIGKRVMKELVPV